MILINDLQRHTDPLMGEIESALSRVARSGWFIMGKEVQAFEREFAEWCGAAECIAVGNGTDALEISLRALGVGAGDRVATVANAGAYSSIALVSIGAVPVFVDIDDASLNMDPKALASSLDGVKAVIATHLYGRMADVAAIAAAARAKGVPLIEDCAQSHGAKSGGKRCGTFGDLATFSFYPTKNLGAVGDGGAIVAHDAQLAARVKQLRQYGWTSKYLSSVAGGRNSRLDEAQAAVLRVKLPHLRPETVMRRLHAAFYRDALVGGVVPVAERDPGHVYHLFPVRSARRDALQAHLARTGVETLIHYPIPLHKQPAFAQLAPRECPVAAQAAGELLSLPLHGRLHARQAARVVDAIQAFEKGSIDA